MQNINNVFSYDNINKGCFSDNYISIVNHFVLKSQNNTNSDITASLICDPPISETKEKRIKEELVRCIWYGQHFNKDKLVTENGSRIEIIAPGWWNVEDGPDFHHAEIIFSDSGYKKGEVEIHVYSNDWKKHGHTFQETYNDVCLHVVLWNNLNNEFVYNRNGSPIPQLALSKYLNAELDELFETINFDNYPSTIKTNAGLCQKSITFSDLSDESIGLFLDAAGDERILSKARRYKKVQAQGTYEQTLYETTMEALGYKNNKEPFLKLANILQYNDIQELVPVDLDYKKKVLYVQAALFGMSGLLETRTNKSEDEEPEYIKNIEKIWNENISNRVKNAPMDASAWKFSKTRPTNFPTRRIAAISHIITKSLNDGILKFLLRIFAKAENAKNEKERSRVIKNGIDEIFLELFDDYWSYYYTFNGKRLSKPERLLGKDRTSDILINVLIPLLLLNARGNKNIELEKSLHILYRNYPKLSSNSVIKFMVSRIFENDKFTNKIICNSRRQQGLHQLFKDFCDSDNFICNKCALYLMLQN